MCPSPSMGEGAGEGVGGGQAFVICYWQDDFPIPPSSGAPGETPFSYVTWPGFAALPDFTGIGSASCGGGIFLRLA